VVWISNTADKGGIPGKLSMQGYGGTELVFVAWIARLAFDGRHAPARDNKRQVYAGIESNWADQTRKS
jgi:hypothetical protein